MRIGLVLGEGQEATQAKLAEAHGLFGVIAGWGDPLTAVNAAIYASTATEFVRVVTRVRLGLEHPVTIAEELSILDNVNNGRTIVLADTGELTPESATDEIAVVLRVHAPDPHRPRVRVLFWRQNARRRRELRTGYLSANRAGRHAHLRIVANPLGLPYVTPRHNVELAVIFSKPNWSGDTRWHPGSRSG